eukprot:GHVQ01036873.1.p1 GENE.GHVQ01036873.1~~GHVQ01036873.1.p1  ORF type:complete len:1595 (+),score=268.34 GHVQ01036873.1:298-5082(+)
MCEFTTLINNVFNSINSMCPFCPTFHRLIFFFSALVLLFNTSHAAAHSSLHSQEKPSLSTTTAGAVSPQPPLSSESAGVVDLPPYFPYVNNFISSSNLSLVLYYSPRDPDYVSIYRPVLELTKRRLYVDPALRELAEQLTATQCPARGNGCKIGEETEIIAGMSGDHGPLCDRTTADQRLDVTSVHHGLHEMLFGVVNGPSLLKSSETLQKGIPAVCGNGKIRGNTSRNEQNKLFQNLSMFNDVTPSPDVSSCSPVMASLSFLHSLPSFRLYRRGVPLSWNVHEARKHVILHPTTANTGSPEAANTSQSQHNSRILSCRSLYCSSSSRFPQIPSMPPSSSPSLVWSLSDSLIDWLLSSIILAPRVPVIFTASHLGSFVSATKSGSLSPQTNTYYNHLGIMAHQHRNSADCVKDDPSVDNVEGNMKCVDNQDTHNNEMLEKTIQKNTNDLDHTVVIISAGVDKEGIFNDNNNIMEESGEPSGQICPAAVQCTATNNLFIPVLTDLAQSIMFSFYDYQHPSSRVASPPVGMIRPHKDSADYQQCPSVPLHTLAGTDATSSPSTTLAHSEAIAVAAPLYRHPVTESKMSFAVYISPRLMNSSLNNNTVDLRISVLRPFASRESEAYESSIDLTPFLPPNLLACQGMNSTISHATSKCTTNVHRPCYDSGKGNMLSERSVTTDGRPLPDSSLCLDMPPSVLPSIRRLPELIEEVSSLGIPAVSTLSNPNDELDLFDNRIVRRLLVVFYEEKQRKPTHETSTMKYVQNSYTTSETAPLETSLNGSLPNKAPEITDILQALRDLHRDCYHPTSPSSSLPPFCNLLANRQTKLVLASSSHNRFSTPHVTTNPPASALSTKTLSSTFSPLWPVLYTNFGLSPAEVAAMADECGKFPAGLLELNGGRTNKRFLGFLQKPGTCSLSNVGDVNVSGVGPNDDETPGMNNVWSTRGIRHTSNDHGLGQPIGVSLKEQLKSLLTKHEAQLRQGLPGDILNATESSVKNLIDSNRTGIDTDKERIVADDDGARLVHMDSPTHMLGAKNFSYIAQPSRYPAFWFDSISDLQRTVADRNVVTDMYITAQEARRQSTTSHHQSTMRNHSQPHPNVPQQQDNHLSSNPFSNFTFFLNVSRNGGLQLPTTLPHPPVHCGSISGAADGSASGPAALLIVMPHVVVGFTAPPRSADSSIDLYMNNFLNQNIAYKGIINNMTHPIENTNKREEQKQQQRPHQSATADEPDMGWLTDPGSESFCVPADESADFRGWCQLHGSAHALYADHSLDKTKLSHGQKKHSRYSKQEERDTAGCEVCPRFESMLSTAAKRISRKVYNRRLIEYSMTGRGEGQGTPDSPSASLKPTNAHNMRQHHSTLLEQKGHAENHHFDGRLQHRARQTAALTLHRQTLDIPRQTLCDMSQAPRLASYRSPHTREPREDNTHNESSQSTPSRDSDNQQQDPQTTNSHQYTNFVHPAPSHNSSTLPLNGTGPRDCQTEARIYPPAVFVVTPVLFAVYDVTTEKIPESSSHGVVPFMKMYSPPSIAVHHRAQNLMVSPTAEDGAAHSEAPDTRVSKLLVELQRGKRSPPRYQGRLSVDGILKFVSEHVEAAAGV